jgi:hypothetical protein
MMFGPAAKSMGNDDVKGLYDDGLINTKFLCISEAKGINDDAMERLKRISASENTDMSMLNPKGRARVYMPNLWSIAIITNHINALRMSETERRFFVVNASRVLDDDLRLRYYKWIDGDGASYLMDYLLYGVDLTGFDCNVLPCRTTHFYSMFDMTRTESEQTLYNMSDIGEGLFANDLIYPEHLLAVMRMRDIKCTLNSVMVWLHKAGWCKFDTSFKISKKVGGKMVPKPRAWLYKKGGCYDPTVTGKLSGTEVWNECDRIEKVVVNTFTSKF